MHKTLTKLITLTLVTLTMQSPVTHAAQTLETALNQRAFHSGPKSKELSRASCLARHLFLDGTSNYAKLTSDEILALQEITEPTLPDLAVEGVNVNLTCQYAYFVRAGQITKLFPISSGRPGHETKPGVFKIWYQYNHWWESTLYPGAMMYRPKYFDGDRAFHGLKSDTSVRPYPDSHGCLRTKKTMMDYLWKTMVKTDQVRVYGKYQGGGK